MNMTEAICRAREALRTVTEKPVDSIIGCEAQNDGAWRIRLDVLEARARLGDDDLLAAYDVRINAAGDVQAIQREARYRRTTSAATQKVVGG